MIVKMLINVHKVSGNLGVGTFENVLEKACRAAVCALAMGPPALVVGLPRAPDASYGCADASWPQRVGRLLWLSPVD